MSYTIDIQEGPEESSPLVGQTPEQSDHCYSPSGSFGLHLLQPDGHRSDREQQAQQMAGYGTGSQTSPTPIGVAFSGGGIRSAAFCSGVLRWILKNDNLRMDYLSCVSGGGYTGAAFLSWMHRKGTDTKVWQDKFFETMHQNAGYLCNFQKPRSAILDPFFFIFFFIVTVLVLPCLLWFPYAFPVAEAVDFLCGDILRESSSCDEPGNQPTVDPKKSKTSYLLMELYGNCSPTSRRITLFTTTFLLSLILYIISRSGCKFSRRFKGLLRLFSIVIGLFFAFTFLPWITYDFLWPIQVWIQVVVFFIFLVLPFFFPIIRNYAGLFLFFYVYVFIVSWKVFKIELLGKFPYSDALFYLLLVICCALIVLFPILATMHRALFNAYYRWSLSKAFFKDPEGFPWKDVFPFCWVVCESLRTWIGKFKKSPRQHDMDEEEPPVDKKEIYLSDLSNIQPKFISNITVNDWQIGSRQGPCHHLIAFSTEDVKVIGKYVDEEGKSVKPESLSDLNNRDCVQLFKPEHMPLSRAMAISGAALSFDMGSYETSLDMILDLLSLLGLGMGAELPSDQVNLKEKPFREACKQFLLEVLVLSPLIAILFCYLLGSKINVLTGLILVHIGVLFVLSFIAVQDTGFPDDKGGCNGMSSILRWLLPRLFFAGFLRGFLNINHVSTKPPPVLRLSDGGHFENLALLPLLEKKLDRIVVVDGSCNPGGEKYADALLHAINKAREKLHCSFTPLTNNEETEGGETRDIEEDIRVRFLTKKNGRLPRHYRFKVHYYDVIDVNGVSVDIFSGKTGEILFLAPRHPEECKEFGEAQNDKNWEDFDVEEKENPDHPWRRPRKLTKDKANRLTWCCCRCCHGELKEGNKDKASKLACCGCKCDRKCCSCFCFCFPGDICHHISSFFLRGGFPHHTTGNQFFTPDMFSAYHCEGLAASIEAAGKAKKFF